MSDCFAYGKVYHLIDWYQKDAQHFGYYLTREEAQQIQLIYDETYLVELPALILPDKQFVLLSDVRKF